MLENISFESIGVRISYDFNPQNGVINNVQVLEIDFLGVIEWIEYKMGLSFDLIQRYCIDRVLTHYRLYQEQNWRIKTEIDLNLDRAQIGGIYIRPDFAREIESRINTLDTWSTNGQLALIYKMEYDIVPSAINKCNWEAKRIDKDQLEISEDGETDIDDELLSNYQGYNLPRGLCVKNNNKYKVIDGRYRCRASNEKRIQMIVGE